jgi:hypothetical protein
VVREDLLIGGTMQRYVCCYVLRFFANSFRLTLALVSNMPHITQFCLVTSFQELSFVALALACLANKKKVRYTILSFCVS